MREFTKGPWVVRNGDLKNPHLYQMVGPLYIANDVKIPDLYLTSAAPDMLEALEMIEAMTDLWLPNQVAEEHIEEAKALHKMRAAYLKAIAKAKGESQ